MADALASGARARKGVQVQVLFPAPQTVRKPATLAGFRHVIIKSFSVFAGDFLIRKEISPFYHCIASINFFVPTILIALRML